MHLYSGGLSKTAVAVVAGIACGVMVSGTAEAADKLLGYATGSYDTVIYGGFDFSHANSQQNGFGIDGGFVTAINGDITTTGWTVSANLGFSQSNDVATDTDSVSGSVLAGYQWHSPEYYFALNAGIAVVNGANRAA